jgi:hypothetical protein
MERKICIISDYRLTNSEKTEQLAKLAIHVHAVFLQGTVRGSRAENMYNIRLSINVFRQKLYLNNLQSLQFNSCTYVQLSGKLLYIVKDLEDLS